MVRLSNSFLLIIFAALLHSDNALARQADYLNTNLSKQLHRADIYYSQDRFREAYRDYIRLARIGSKHAQFRVAELMFEGRGTGKNPTKAFAWATVAAEFDLPEAINLRELIWDSLDEDSRNKAMAKAEKQLKNFNDHEIASLLLKRVRGYHRMKGIHKTGPNANIQHYVPRDGDFRPVSNLEIFDQLSFFEAIEETLEQYVSGTVTLGEFRVIEPAEKKSDDNPPGPSSEPATVPEK